MCIQTENKIMTTLDDKIQQAIDETRMVLPGAQALLGFQFVSVFSEGFTKLPQIHQYIHLASLGIITLATIFLMAPASYHRIVNEGENNLQFHKFASNMIVCAMVALALGISGDIFVVIAKVTQSFSAAVGNSVCMLLLFYGFWFGYIGYKKVLIKHKDSKATNETKERNNY